MLLPPQHPDLIPFLVFGRHEESLLINQMLENTNIHSI